MTYSKSQQLGTTKLKKRRSRKKSNINKTAWKWFSLFIRARDCLEQTGSIEEGNCVTCGDRYKFKELQAGHCIPGRNHSILFDERLVNAQCSHCNKNVQYGGLGGNYAKYHIWYIEKYGLEDFKEKERLSKELLKLNAVELVEISDKYRLKYRELTKVLN